MRKSKTKTLAVILNHNLPEYTSWLYNALKPHEKDIYDLLIMDNGSLPHLIPANTTIKLEKNLFWGGALNVAFKLVLENPEYDSLLYLNNDLELTGEIFVEALRWELFQQNFVIVSPCISGKAAPWKQMQNWATRKTREVKWIDNQAPLFHRKIIEALRQFPDELYYGWGQELICFDICQEKGWKTGVCDHIAILHYGMQTLKQQRLFTDDPHEGMKPVALVDSHAQAMSEYRGYFAKNPLKYGDFEDLRNYGETYQFPFVEPGFNLNFLKRIK